LTDENKKIGAVTGDTEVQGDTVLNSSSSGEVPESFPEPLPAESLSTLGKFYRITRKIGEGGMGVVYEVEHTRMGKKFAAKVISKSYASDRDAVKRFELEAVAASKIDSPHIVQVVHLDTEGEYTYIVMELLKGRNLASVIHRRILPVPLAVEIAKQVARGLIAAHDAGIVHRDLKPENIFLVNQDGQLFVKILDFGISKIRYGGEAGVKLTKTGQIIGTPLYFSPEQAKGIMDVDGRTDIYALGVILFEMVTGRPVFESTNPIELMMKHASEPPPLPSMLNPEVSGALEKIILKCLAKNLEDRYQNATELYNDLCALKVEPITRETVVSATTITDPVGKIVDSSKPFTSVKVKSSSKWWLIPVIIVLIVAVGGGGFWFLKGRVGKDSGGSISNEGRESGSGRGVVQNVVSDSSTSASTEIVEEVVNEIALTITSTPENAEVWKDGKMVGTTPFIFKTVSNGADYIFEIKAKGFKTETVVMKAENDSAKHVTLTRIKKGTKTDVTELKKQTE